MKQFEYTALHIPSREHMKILGLEGWEAYAVEHQITYMKREIKT